ncbi:cation:proton antiporter regulatory subunit [Halorussus salinus]|uniref:cation:proton antiporter regulatory subunit n=1 Tax=Halorussus salinus TaxID=1364935 RepID=UPI001092BD1A|nr:TrkA C-terminal domain-containing protein [Halorussus salinus]
MTVYETELPGVGRKYELELDDDRLVVVVHHDGDRDVYRRAPDAGERPPNSGGRSSTAGETTHLFCLRDEQARKLGAVLEGAYFQPVALDSVEVPVGDALIEWYRLPADAPLAGGRLGDANVREATGATLLAVRRDGETHPSPDPDFELLAGDWVVALGARDEQKELKELVTGE